MDRQGRRSVGQVCVPGEHGIDGLGQPSTARLVCIDKRNHVELSEAINSMFKWYRGTKKCYVYLPDVSIPEDSKYLFTQYYWEPVFRKSNWFARGWTLQEPIAPVSVEFFSLKGKLLGNRKSLKHQIHEITRINIQALQGGSSSQFDFAERMSWARYRDTRVEEDSVYCLLGICDILVRRRRDETMRG